MLGVGPTLNMVTFTGVMLVIRKKHEARSCRKKWEFWLGGEMGCSAEKACGWLVVAKVDKGRKLEIVLPQAGCSD